MKGIKAAKTVGTLALGFLTLVETAYLFGIGKVRGPRRRRGACVDCGSRCN